MAPVLGTAEHLTGDFAVLMVDTTPSTKGCQAGTSLQYMQAGLRSSTKSSRVAFQDMMELEYSDSTAPLAPYIQPFSQSTQQYVALLLNVTGCGMGLSALEVAADRRENFNVADVVQRSGAQVVAAAYFSSTGLQPSKARESRKKAQSPFQKRSAAITILNHEPVPPAGAPTPIQGAPQPLNPSPPLTATGGGQLPVQTFEPLNPLPGTPPPPPPPPGELQGGLTPPPPPPPGKSQGGPPPPPPSPGKSQGGPMDGPIMMPPPMKMPGKGPPQPVAPQPIAPPLNTAPTAREDAITSTALASPQQQVPVRVPGQAQVTGALPPILRGPAGAIPTPIQNQNQVLPTASLSNPLQSLLPGNPIFQQPNQPVRQQPGTAPIQQQPGQVTQTLGAQPTQQQPGQQTQRPGGQPIQQQPNQGQGTRPAIIATGGPAQATGVNGAPGLIRTPVTSLTTPFLPGQTGNIRSSAVGGGVALPQSSSAAVPGAGGGVLPPILQPVNGGAQPSNGGVGGVIGGSPTQPAPGQQTQPSGLPVNRSAGGRISVGWGITMGGLVLGAALLL